MGQLNTYNAIYWEKKKKIELITSHKLQKKNTEWVLITPLDLSPYGPLTKYVKMLVHMRWECRERLPRHRW